ncbi:MAG TPA: hypothetical protein DIW81_11600, partial [Planctomycetaceae bacterium]|nr:hypothetical protein [Planctomycetaceae bacterium]
FNAGAILLLILLCGCGTKSQPESANLRYATDVTLTRIQETRRDKMTSFDSTIRAYRQCAFRLKAMSDRDVSTELANAVHRYADHCLVFADELAAFQRTPGADFAFIEGMAGLYFGANPYEVGERAGSRMANINQAWTRVEYAHTQLEAKEADLWRESWSSLTPEESGMLTARLQPLLSDVQANLAKTQQTDTPVFAASTAESIPLSQKDKNQSQEVSKPPSHPVSRFIWYFFGFIYSWFGTGGVMVALGIIAAILFFNSDDSTKDSNKPNDSKATVAKDS